MSTIPLEFGPDAYGAEGSSEHLEIKISDEIITARWPLLDITVRARKTYSWADTDSLVEMNDGRFCFVENYGYSIGQFHEIFLGNVPGHASYRFGAVEVTIGYATPFGAYLFEQRLDDDVYGEFCYISSARIYGTEQENIEIYLLNALIKYHEKYRVLPSPIDISGYEYFDDEQDDRGDVEALPPFSAEVEPTRFHYFGLLHSDAASACLYFYRVLEFFAFASLQNELSRLRHDDGVSERDFAKQVAQLVFKDERGPIQKLVASLLTEAELVVAKDKELIEKSDKTLLASKLYEFRNSLVHAKYDQRFNIFSTSILSDGSEADNWRPILESLSKRALANVGRRM